MQTTLTVLYDARCDLCNRIREWMQRQPKYIEVLFIAALSEEARQRYPLLDHELTVTELHVVSNYGEVYRGAKAWLMCLWALREYRLWALRLAAPELMPLARRVIARVSSNRFRLARYGGFLRG
jgi:predicted DCC family thiol-disulfide oxidoreductase YuxK